MSGKDERSFEALAQPAMLILSCGSVSARPGRRRTISLYVFFAVSRNDVDICRALFVYNPLLSLLSRIQCAVLVRSVGTYYVTTDLASPCSAFECHDAYFASPHPPPGSDETYLLSGSYPLPIASG